MALMPRPFAGGLTGGLTDDFFSPFFGGFPDITRDLTRALQPLTAGGESMALATRGMPVDVVEKDNSFEVKADIPGVTKDNIKVTVDKDVLRINVEKVEEKKEEDKERRYHRWERSSQFVGRALRMPENANLEGVKARYENGVLMLDVPKSEQKKEETKRITIG